MAARRGGGRRGRRSGCGGLSGAVGGGQPLLRTQAIAGGLTDEEQHRAEPSRPPAPALPRVLSAGPSGRESQAVLTPGACCEQGLEAAAGRGAPRGTAQGPAFRGTRSTSRHPSPFGHRCPNSHRALADHRAGGAGMSSDASQVRHHRPRSPALLQRTSATTGSSTHLHRPSATPVPLHHSPPPPPPPAGCRHGRGDRQPHWLAARGPPVQLRICASRGGDRGEGPPSCWMRAGAPLPAPCLLPLPPAAAPAGAHPGHCPRTLGPCPTAGADARGVAGVGAEHAAAHDGGHAGGRRQVVDGGEPAR